MAKSGSRSRSASGTKSASKTAKRRAGGKGTATKKKSGGAKGGAAKGGAKRGAARRPKKPAHREVELRPIRKQLFRAVDTLKTFTHSPKVEDAIRRLDMCLAEINEICGPDMAIPDPSDSDPA